MRPIHRPLHLLAWCLLVGLSWDWQPASSFVHRPRLLHTFIQSGGSSNRISSTANPAGSEADSLTDKPVLGRPHTASSRAKIAAKNKGKVPWNVGKAHSDETRKLIAEKTREAMLRRKLEKLAALGMTLEDYDQERVQRKHERKQAMRTGLTLEGRRRISESVKRRWQDPEFRRHYAVTNRGARNHSEATRAKISEAITLKWKDVDYRAKVRRNPTDEERARISATLKLKWRDPEFRNRMLNHSFPRTDEWRNLVSEKIREKWQDPTYRESVTSAIRASNRTGPGVGGKVRLRPSRAPTPRRPRQSPDEVKARKRAARQALKEKNSARKEAFKVAKQAAQRSGGSTRLKELLGRELWFEEKMKRRGKGDALLDDESLEKQLAAEMGQEDDDEEEEEEEDDDDDDDEDEDDDDLYEDDDDGGGSMGTFSDDVIEVYDEDGNLVGEYTDEEWEQLRKARVHS